MNGLLRPSRAALTALQRQSIRVSTGILGTAAAGCDAWRTPLNRRPTMPRSRKTWTEKMCAKPPHTVVLDKAFAGVPQGARLLISSPQEIDAFVRTLPPGRSLPIQQLRRELAARHGADAACPVSTSLFLRIVAEHAFERLQAGDDICHIAPVWRVIEPDSPLMRKLSFDVRWITERRQLEGLPA
ncbi:hypothetical protein GCM10023090_31930 [Acidovorax lacteus]|uniref:Uncharacterized protein n=2 Tax=Acidovorax lacteus TaxID=1924988 RepID=A0ABP8LLB5_9BURK